MTTTDRLTVIIGDDVAKTCDGCGAAWPNPLPGGYCWHGRDAQTGRPIIELFCTAECAARRGGRAADHG